MTVCTVIKVQGNSWGSQLNSTWIEKPGKEIRKNIIPIRTLKNIFIKLDAVYYK
jgi:hypothetical protein